VGDQGVAGAGVGEQLLQAVAVNGGAGLLVGPDLPVGDAFGVLEGDGDRRCGEFLAEHREEMAALLELARLDEFDTSALNDTLHSLDLSPSL
jgi:hypothetical protein